MTNSPLYLPEGYQKRTRSKTEGVASTGQVAKTGTVTHTEHWNGSVDATVRPRTARMKVKATMGADPNPYHVHAIAAFEKATRRLDFARKSGDKGFLVKAERAMLVAQERLEATQ
jgi:hypothetical protein